MTYAIVIRNVAVASVWEGFKSHYISGVGKEAVFEKRSIGWFISLDGSAESLYVGDENPELAKGDLVTIRIERQHGSIPRPRKVQARPGKAPNRQD